MHRILMSVGIVSLSEYLAVESLDNDDNKYKRKSPMAMLAKWARYSMIYSL